MHTGTANWNIVSPATHSHPHDLVRWISYFRLHVLDAGSNRRHNFGNLSATFILSAHNPRGRYWPPFSL